MLNIPPTIERPIPAITPAGGGISNAGAANAVSVDPIPPQVSPSFIYFIPSKISPIAPTPSFQSTDSYPLLLSFTAGFTKSVVVL